MPATAIPTLEVAGGKKRPRDETYSNERRYPRNVRAQTRSMSRFDERYAELMRYKEKFRHCNVRHKGSVEYPSLGSWCI